MNLVRVRRRNGSSFLAKVVANPTGGVLPRYKLRSALYHLGQAEITLRQARMGVREITEAMMSQAGKTQGRKILALVDRLVEDVVADRKGIKEVLREF
jgi:hypothetical protein